MTHRETSESAPGMPSQHSSMHRCRRVLGLGVEQRAMVQVSITAFTGSGQPVAIVPGDVTTIKSQSEPKPALRLICGNR
jgi:hypothetical protein